MQEKTLETSSGVIHYWINKINKQSRIALIFLPGLTADHRLFDKQIEYFKDKFRVLVWDAPGHASSYPFDLDFDLFDLGAIRLTTEQGLNKIRVSPNDFNLYEIIYYRKWI